MRKRHEEYEAEQPVEAGSAKKDVSVEDQNVSASDTEQDGKSDGKFKDQDQLRRAYEALEAEFTRRSQQLARLSREHEQLLQQQRQIKDQNERKTALDEFIRRYPKAADMRAELEERLGETVGDYGQTISAAYMDILDREHQTRESLLNDQDFIDACVLDQRISDEVIRRYLMQGAEAPATLRGGYIPVTTRSQAVTLDQAGEMAKEIYK